MVQGDAPMAVGEKSEHHPFLVQLSTFFHAHGTAQTGIFPLDTDSLPLPGKKRIHDRFRGLSLFTGGHPPTATQFFASRAKCS